MPPATVHAGALAALRKAAGAGAAISGLTDERFVRGAGDIAANIARFSGSAPEEPQFTVNADSIQCKVVSVFATEAATPAIGLLRAYLQRYERGVDYDSRTTERGPLKTEGATGVMIVVGMTLQGLTRPVLNYNAATQELDDATLYWCLRHCVLKDGAEAVLTAGLALMRAVHTRSLIEPCLESAPQFACIVPGTNLRFIRHPADSVSWGYSVGLHTDPGVPFVMEAIDFCLTLPRVAPNNAAPSAGLPRSCGRRAPAGCLTGWGFLMSAQAQAFDVGGVPNATSLLLVQPTSPHGTLDMCCELHARVGRCGSACIAKARHTTQLAAGFASGGHARHAIRVGAPRVLSAPKL